ncbi:heme-binding protein soul2 [Hypomesus transpacificus]|uniref:heme-binding protein soul2 n=1 Tax=Hypomesus transpacificus TaxID=137520 RepID=UPI001F07A18E|nr:heme-binding protein soul2 [Hypomesus transpacificus]
MKCNMIVLVRIAVLWMFSFGVQGWVAPDFCRGSECPEFTLVQKIKEFEERAYFASRWITTEVASAKQDDVKAGFMRLYQYCKGQNEGSASVTTKTWPAIITITEVGSADGDVSVSFFIPPGTVLPKPHDTTIREENIPARTVYVKIFGGFPSYSAAQANVKQLRDELNEAGKAFELHKYTGAGYQSPWEIFNHHNEVWVEAV